MNFLYINIDHKTRNVLYVKYLKSMRFQGTLARIISILAAKNSEIIDFVFYLEQTNPYYYAAKPRH